MIKSLNTGIVIPSAARNLLLDFVRRPALDIATFVLLFFHHES